MYNSMAFQYIHRVVQPPSQLRLGYFIAPSLRNDLSLSYHPWPPLPRPRWSLVYFLFYGLPSLDMSYEWNLRPWQVWLSWLEHRPIHQKVAGLIPNQDMYLDCGFNTRLGRQPINVSHINVSVSESSLPLSLKSINISSGEGFLKYESVVNIFISP